MISEAVKNANATAKTGSTPAVQPPKAGDVTSDKNDAFKAKGKALRETMSEDEKAIEGSASDKVAFICALGDPNRQQSRVDQRQNVPSFTVVGYKFEALEDMEVPEMPLRPDFKTPLDVADSYTMVPVKKGEKFSLNIIETAVLISDTKYAGEFKGGDKPVKLSSANSKGREYPLPVLKLIGPGSIKVNMDTVANMVGATATDKGKPVVKDEYAAKFGVLYEKKKLTKGATASKKSESSADLAAAFRNLYAGKRA